MKLTSKDMNIAMDKALERFLKANEIKSTPEVVAAFYAGATNAAAFMRAPLNVVSKLCDPGMEALKSQKGGAK